tara:strand:- start:213 stop:812 length:600 start_codon:yes stop_codon:yes gene_type:complete
MSSIKLTADSSGGTIELKAPPTTTSNAAKVITLSQNPGMVTQVVSTTKTDTYSVTVSANSTAGANAIEVSITPSSSTNKILILVSAHASSEYMGSVDHGAVQATLYKGSSVLVQGDAASNRARVTMRAGDSDASSIEEPLNFNYLDTAGGTSAITYGIRLHNSDNGSKVMYLNRSHTDTDSATSYTRTVSTITVMEISG